MINFYNKNYLLMLKKKLEKKNFLNISKSKYLIRNGPKKKFFIDNYFQVIYNYKKTSKIGSSLDYSQMHIKTTMLSVNYQFYIITKKNTFNYSVMDFILLHKQQNNFVILTPKIGSFFVYANGFTGLLKFTELKKMLKNIKILNFYLYLKIFYKKFLILRFPIKSSRFLLVYKYKEYSINKLIFKIID